MSVRHWIIETMVYDLPRFGMRIRVCTRVGCSDLPGVWLVKGEIKGEWSDTFEMRDTPINSSEYFERSKRMHCYWISFTPPAQRWR